MPFDNEIASKSPGQALLDVPVPKLIEMTAKAIANAQYELDASAVRAATLMSETTIDFRDAEGNVTPKSLLELGLPRPSTTSAKPGWSSRSPSPRGSSRGSTSASKRAPHSRTRR
jgi:hypothetical protein